METNVTKEERPEREDADDVNETAYAPQRPWYMVLEEGNRVLASSSSGQYHEEISSVLLEGNRDLASSSSGQHGQHQPNDITIDIKEFEELKEILGPKVNYLNDIFQEPVPQRCIYRVPTNLRKINEAAYTPQVISIGPLHHGKKEFFEMEKQKLRYILEFRKREGGAEKLKEFKMFIQVCEQSIRTHYAENSSLSSPEFVNMILHDSVFIIEFFLKNEQQEREIDFFLDTPCVKAAITRDLQLLENQLPYSLLKRFFEHGAFHNFTKEDYPDSDPFLILSHRFFFNPKDGVFPKPNVQIQPYEIQHFTDLRRYFLLMNFCPQEEQPAHIRDLPIATKLSGSGVNFKKGIEGRSSLEISCEYAKRAIRIPFLKSCELQITCIKKLELQIPRFEIDDRTECLYRNMMALELCHYPSATHICNFILLMDVLIDTEKDIDLLVDEGIIFNCLGDNAAIVKMFNNLGLQITPSRSVYHNIGEKLKAHYARRWNHTMVTLTTVYFRDIWTGTATVAAFIILVLTFIQTVFSIVK